MMANVKLQRKGYRLEDREMDGYAMLYRAYLARLDLPRKSIVARLTATQS